MWIPISSMRKVKYFCISYIVKHQRNFVSYSLDIHRKFSYVVCWLMCSTLFECLHNLCLYWSKITFLSQVQSNPQFTVFQIYAKCLFCRHCIGTHIYDIVLRKINYQITSIVWLSRGSRIKNRKQPRKATNNSVRQNCKRWKQNTIIVHIAIKLQRV